MTKAGDLAAGEYTAGILFQAYDDDVARAYLCLLSNPACAASRIQALKYEVRF